MIVPFLFQLQSDAYQSSVLSESQKRAISSLIVEYFLSAADYLSLDGFKKHLETVKQSRIINHSWTPGFEFTEQAVESFGTRQFRYQILISDLEANMNLSLDVELSREEIVELIAREVVHENAEELQPLQNAWSKDFINAPEIAVAIKPLVKKITKKMIHRRSVSAKSNSVVPELNKKSEKPSATINISDLKDALSTFD